MHLSRVLTGGFMNLPQERWMMETFPYLVNVNEDPQLSGVLKYFIQEGSNAAWQLLSLVLHFIVISLSSINVGMWTPGNASKAKRESLFQGECNPNVYSWRDEWRRREKSDRVNTCTCSYTYLVQRLFNLLAVLFQLLFGEGEAGTVWQGYRKAPPHPLPSPLPASSAALLKTWK